MSSISKEQLEHLAKLARIELSEEEKGKFTSDLSSILDYIAKLNKVDTSKIGLLAESRELKSATREDEFRKNDHRAANREKLLNEAPAKHGDYIRVPKILE